MKRLILLIAAASLASMSAMAEGDHLTLDAQLRARGEYRDTKSAFINERARISFGYQKDFFEIKISGQHTGVWGQTAQNPVNNGDFSLNEAWARLNAGQWYFKAGRQTLVYDDERILGGLDWHVAGRSHDVLKIGYASKNGRHRLDIAGAFNQNAIKSSGGTFYSAADAQPYKHMEMAWYHFGNGSHPFGMSFLVMNLGFQKGTAEKPEVQNMQTFGTYLTMKAGPVFLEGSAYGQTCDGAKAWMASFKGNVKCCDAFSAAIGIDHLSETFNPLYGTHHKFYGTLDYWYINRGKMDGLTDPYLALNATFTKVLSASLTGHAFFQKSGYQNAEVDLQLNCKLHKSVTIMGGWSTLFGPVAAQNWLWLQLNVAPRILNR